MQPEQPSLTTSNFNLQQLNTKEYCEHIGATIEFGGNIAIFGQRGSGKTTIAKVKIKDMDLIEVYMNLSVMERVDIGGYPDIMAPQKGEEFVNCLLPKIVEPMIKGNKKVVLVLDEIDKADASLWAPMLELTQFHTMNGRILPNLWAIVMTGNLLAEGGSRPCLPLLDRTEKYLLEADSQSWLDWASSEGKIHPLVFAYLKDNPNDLFGKLDPGGECYATASPRGWEMASNIQKFGEKHNWSSALLNKKIAGCVGHEISIRFNNYYEHYQYILPVANAIYQGEDVHASGKYNDLEETKKMMTCIIAVNKFASILHELKAKNIKQLPIEAVYLGKFLQGVDIEHAMMAIRNQIDVTTMMNYQLDRHSDWKQLFDDVESLLNGPSDIEDAAAE